MNISSLPPDLREKFEDIAAMCEPALERLGLNTVIRDCLLDGIVVPDDPSDCWPWNKGHNGKGLKARPVIRYKGRILLAYRVLMALLNKKHIDDLCWILHKCPGREHGWCMNPCHLCEATSWETAAKENAEDRSRYKTLHGENNGSAKHRECHEGTRNGQSQFKDPEGIRWIQALRATYDQALDKHGLIAALVRFSGKSRDAVTHVVKRLRYTDIPDDPSAAIDPSLLKINGPEDSAKRRKHWPSGDKHAGSRMPMAAKRAFVILFHRIRKRKQKRVLIDFCVSRYGLSYSTVQSFGHDNPQDVGAPAKVEIQKFPVIEEVTEELLNSTFDKFPPINHEGGGK